MANKAGNVGTDYIDQVSKVLDAWYLLHYDKPRDKRMVSSEDMKLFMRVTYDWAYMFFCADDYSALEYLDKSIEKGTPDYEES